MYKFINVEKDKYTDRNYYIVNDFDKSLSELKQIALNVSYPKVPLATIGSDAVMQLNNKDILVFKDISTKIVREKLFSDYQDYNFTISFKTAEYHSYFQLLNKSTNKKYFIGLGPKEYSAKFGYSYLRDEEKYENKYFRGLILKSPLDSELTPMFDWASLSISFDLNHSQVLELEKFLKSLKIKMDNDKVKYNIITDNCAHFLDNVYKFLYKDGGHFMQFYRTDSLDLRDKGVFFSLIQAHGLGFIFNNKKAALDIVSYAIFGKSVDSILDNMYLSYSGKTIGNILKFITKPFVSHDKLYYNETPLHIAAFQGNIEVFNDFNYKNDINKQDDFGYTPLHLALLNSKLNFALKLIENGADLNIKAKDHSLPIHIVLSKEYNNNELVLNKLTHFIIEGTKDINSTDYSGYNTSLTYAVKSNNISNIKLLIENNADINFKNPEFNNLAHIAAKHHLTDVLRFFQEKYPYLLEMKNLDNYLPEDLLTIDKIYYLYPNHEIDITNGVIYTEDQQKYILENNSIINEEFI